MAQVPIAGDRRDPIAERIAAGMRDAGSDARTLLSRVLSAVAEAAHDRIAAAQVRAQRRWMDGSRW